MKVIVGSDDSGAVYDAVVEALGQRGLEVEVLEREGWPSVARKVGEAVASGTADFGVLMCWTGTGTSMMANKIPGVRAALCWEPWIAEGARRWNDANVLVLSLKRTPSGQVPGIIDAWLSVAEPDPDELANIEELKNADSRPAPE
ncbi:MAG: RpiB/LacA/LacB family sugar-phosphate isomerase [Actinomycetota bacterium]